MKGDKLSRLYPDLLIEIVIELDDKSILDLCTRNKEINRKICDNDIFWWKRFYRKYGKYIDNDKYRLKPEEISWKKYYGLVNIPLYYFEGYEVYHNLENNKYKEIAYIVGKRLFNERHDFIADATVEGFLFEAIADNNVEFVKGLLDAGADPYLEEIEYQLNGIQEAIIQKNTQLIKLFLGYGMTITEDDLEEIEHFYSFKIEPRILEYIRPYLT